MYSSSSSRSNKDSIANRIINSKEPLYLNTTDEQTSCIWLNKEECNEWQGPIPISDYKINQDLNPEILIKKLNQPIELNQNIQIRYLKPPEPPRHGDLIIREENDILLNVEPPPQIIRVYPPRPKTPPPLIIREHPPKLPPTLPMQLIKIPGKVITPHRRQIIEHMPQQPAKPQQVIIEKWLPYQSQKRKIVLDKNLFKSENNNNNNNDDNILQLELEIPKSLIESKQEFEIEIECKAKNNNNSDVINDSSFQKSVQSKHISNFVKKSDLKRSQSFTSFTQRLNEKYWL